MHWLMHYTGLDNLSGPWYGFFSGIGSDLGEWSIPVGIIIYLRHHNCAYKPCWRLGRHSIKIKGEMHMVCRHHHRDGHLRVEDIIPRELARESGE